MSTVPDQPTRPNVVIFFTDQQRWDTLGCLGSPLQITPNVDLMARTGTLFENACTTNPVCAPARATMQTGQYPTTTGVYRNNRVLAPDAPTLGRLFGAAGYRTGYVGKWHLASTDPVPGSEQGGYDTWLGANIVEFTSDAHHTVLYDGEGEPVFLPGYRADAVTDAAIRYLARASTQPEPFLLFVSLIEPHHQNELDSYPAPEVYRDSYVGAWLPPDLATLPGTAHRHTPGYYGQIKRVDEAFGRLSEALTSLSLSDSTVLVYASDHGSHFKTRNAEYKRSPHDSSIRVPLVITGPGYRGGRRVATPVSTVDLVPTLLEAAGIDLPDHLDGLPLSRHLRRESTDDDVLIQISETEVGRALRTRRWKYHVVADGHADSPAASSYAERSLYDLAADPYELDNLIGGINFVDVVDDLRARLIRRISQVEGVEVVVTSLPAERYPDRFPTTYFEQRKLTGRMLE